MSDRTSQYVKDIRELRTNGTWQTPDWAKGQAAKLGCTATHAKVIEWGLMQFIEEHEALVLNAESVIESKVEQRLAHRLREMGLKVATVTVATAYQATDKIKSLTSFIKNKFKSDSVNDSTNPPAA